MLSRPKFITYSVFLFCLYKRRLKTYSNSYAQIRKFTVEPVDRRRFTHARQKSDPLTDRSFRFSCAAHGSPGRLVDFAGQGNSGATLTTLRDGPTISRMDYGDCGNRCWRRGGYTTRQPPRARARRARCRLRRYRNEPALHTEDRARLGRRRDAGCGDRDAIPDHLDAVDHHVVQVRRGGHARRQ